MGTEKHSAQNLPRESFVDESVNTILPSAISVVSFEAIVILFGELIASVNQEMARMFAYPFDEVAGKNIGVFIPGDGVRLIREKIANADADSFELTGERKDGSAIRLQARCAKVADNGGATVLALRNVDSLRNEAIRMQEATIMARKDSELKHKFISLVAHNFRSPLVSIVSLLENLSASLDGSKSEEVEDLLDSINSSGDRLMKMVGELATLARLQSGKTELTLKEHDINMVVDYFIDPFKTLAQKKGITLTNEIPEGFSMVADIDLLGQVIQNLTLNAIWFTQKEGRVRLFVPEKSDNEFAIEDNGVGMDSRALDRLFRQEKLFHTEGTSGEKGNGLGLITCKEIMKALRGGIRVGSKMGKGTTIYVCFPSSDDETQTNVLAD